MTQIMHTLIHGKFADGDDELEPTRIVFQALVANSQRIRVMRALLAFSQRNRSRPVIYDEVVKHFEDLNSRRNELVHGYWLHAVEKPASLAVGAVFLQKEEYQSPDPRTAEKLTAAKIRAFSAECRSLSHATPSAS